MWTTRNRSANSANDDGGRRVRQRSNGEMTPLDINLINSSMMRRSNPITLGELLNSNITEISRDGYLDLMLLRSIANGRHGQTNYMVKLINARGGNKSNSSNSNYTRLFLFKVMSKKEGDALVYVMVTDTQNKKLWGRNTTQRDDGTIAVGTCIRIFRPLPIESVMPDGIPSLVTRFNAVVMQTPNMIDEVPINHSISGNTSLAFALNNCLIEVAASTPEETGCAGYFCDKQRIHEVAQYKQGCACYVWSDRRNNMVIDHSLQIQHQTWNQYIPQYSSIRFSSLYQTSLFSTQIRSDVLELSDQFFELEGCISKCIEFINENGGFTVVGWYKRGVINDRSILAVVDNGNNGNMNRNTNSNVDMQVDNGKLNFHPCSIQPTNRDFLDRNTGLGKALYDMKFDVSTLHAMTN